MLNKIIQIITGAKGLEDVTFGTATLGIYAGILLSDAVLFAGSGAIVADILYESYKRSGNPDHYLQLVARKNMGMLSKIH